MALDSVSSFTLSNILQNTVSRLQTQVTTVETENSTGLVADIGLTLGASSGGDVELHQQYADLNALTASNAIVSTQLSTAYNAAASLQQTAANVLSQVINGMSTTPNSSGSAAIQSVASGALESFVASANSEVGGVYVFGGINTGTAAMSSSAASSTGAAQTAAQSAFSTYLTSIGATTSTVTAAQMTSFLSSASFTSLFSGTNWTTNWSNASSTALTNRIGLNLTETTSVSANSQSFQTMAQGLTMLSAFSGQNLNSSAYAALMQSAQTVMNSASTQFTETAAAIGTMQSAVTNANSGISLQQTVLNTQINANEGVNSYAVASQVSELTNQLQVAYSLTAQIQKLSLVNYL